MRYHHAELLSPSDAVVSPSIIGVATSGRLSNVVIIAIGFMEKSSSPPSDFIEKSSSSLPDSWRNRRRCCQIGEGHTSSSSDSYSRCGYDTSKRSNVQPNSTLLAMERTLFRSLKHMDAAAATINTFNM
ncbi:hypothetical protein QL285_006564 [Trifolium repens]|nr:hypothetical protein QL285_006564 [Trifolium repens]